MIAIGIAGALTDARSFVHGSQLSPAAGEYWTVLHATQLCKDGVVGKCLEALANHAYIPKYGSHVMLTYGWRRIGRMGRSQ